MIGGGGVKYITGLINTKLIQDDLQLGLENFTNPVLDSIFKHEIQGSNDVLLADTVDAANTLFHAHRVPGHIVVHNDMAELQVQTFTTGIGGDQNADVTGKGGLHFFALCQIHGTVEADHTDPPFNKELG